MTFKSELKRLIPAAIRDSADLREVFADGTVVPYAGTSAYSAHRYIHLLDELATLSASRGSVHADLIDYAFGGTVTVAHASPSGFVRPGQADRVISAAEVDRYADYLEAFGVTASSLASVHRLLAADLRAVGVGFLLVTTVREAGEATVVLRVAKATHCLITEDRDAPGVMSLHVFSSPVTRRPSGGQSFQTYPLERAVEVEGDGVTTRAAYAVRNGTGPWGRPQDEQALTEMVTEAAYAVLDEKIAGSEVASKYVFTYPDNPGKVVEGYLVDEGDDESEEDDKLDQAAATMRQVLRTETAGVFGFHGEISPGLLKMDVNRDADYRRLQMERCRDVIFSANRWATDLTGATAPSGGIGSGYLRDLIAFKDATVIGPLRERVSSVVNRALNDVAEAAADTWALEYTHRFSDATARLAFTQDTTE